MVTPNADWNWIPSNIWVGVGQMDTKDVVFPLATVYRKQDIRYPQAKCVAIRPEGDLTDVRGAVEIGAHLHGQAGRHGADPLRLPDHRDQAPAQVRDGLGSRTRRWTHGVGVRRGAR